MSAAFKVDPATLKALGLACRGFRDHLRHGRTRALILLDKYESLLVPGPWSSKRSKHKLALQCAVSYSDPEAARDILRHFQDEAKDPTGASLVKLVTQAWSGEEVGLSHDDYPAAVDGMNVLHLCVHCNNHWCVDVVVDALREGGVSVMATAEVVMMPVERGPCAGYSALHLAASVGSPLCAMSLFRAVSGPGVPKALATGLAMQLAGHGALAGHSALHIAVISNAWRVVRAIVTGATIVTAGASSDIDEDIAHAASAAAAVAMQPVSQGDRVGFSALHIAVVLRRCEVITQLLDCIASVSASSVVTCSAMQRVPQGGCGQLSALHLAAMLDAPDVIRSLVAATARNAGASTAVELACQTWSGMTGFHLAVCMGHHGCVEALCGELVSAGATKTQLARACMRPCLHGDVSLGMSALHMAVSMGHHESAAILATLEPGSGTGARDLAAPSCAGMTTLDLAASDAP
jgi:hypothetical protein